MKKKNEKNTYCTCSLCVTSTTNKTIRGETLTFNSNDYYCSGIIQIKMYHDLILQYYFETMSAILTVFYVLRNHKTITY